MPGTMKVWKSNSFPYVTEKAITKPQHDGNEPPEYANMG